MTTGGGAELDGASCGEGCFSGPATNATSGGFAVCR